MIKDQCDNCNKQGTFNCSLNVVFNGLTCDMYSKRISLEKTTENTERTVDGVETGTNDNQSSGSYKIDLVKHGDNKSVQVDYTIQENDSNRNEDNTLITSEYLKNNTKIHGWLSFFLFSMVLGGLVSAAIPLLTFNVNEYAGSYILALTDVVFGLMLFALACYVLYCFCNRKPDSVFLGKTYTIAIFLSSLFVLFGGEFEATGIGSLKQIIRSLIWSTIWFSYLSISNQVEEILPKDFRKKTSKDYYIVTALIVVPVLFLAIGIGDVITKAEEQTQTFIQTSVLGDNEYTDGKVIFTCPQDFTCEKKELTDPKLTIFELESENIGSVTLCSDYETDYSLANFNGYWTNWQDEGASKYQSQIVINEKRSVNSHSYYYKVTKYSLKEGELYWRFIFLTDVETGKVCILSCYDGGNDSHIDELLSSIRFHQ